MKNVFCRFTRSELLIWLLSSGAILISFLAFDRANYLTLAASLIGATSLIFNAKGNPFGQFLMILFSLLYGIISYTFAYYGEMITYLGMTAPMALVALITWLRNPYGNNPSEVAVSRLKKFELPLIFFLTLIVTTLFYHILDAFDTKNMFLSTLSISTSFIAVYLTFRRNPYFALAYAANDIVLILLWILAAKEDSSYVSVIVCFIIFLINDLYGFMQWRKREKAQRIV